MAVNPDEQSYCSCNFGRSPMLTKDFGDFRLYGGCICGARYSVFKEGTHIIFEVQGADHKEVQKVTAKGLASIWDHWGHPEPAVDANTTFSKETLYDMIRSIRPDIAVAIKPTKSSQFLERNRTKSTLQKETEQFKGQIDFGIIMVRQDEFEAAFSKRFSVIDTVEGLRRYTISQVQTHRGTYVVALARCTDPGHGPAQQLADAMVEDLDPQWLMVVGIAGAVPADEFSLGDVLVATRVPDFSLQATAHQKPPSFDLTGGELNPEVADLVAHLPAMQHNLAGWNTRRSIGLQLPAVNIPPMDSEELCGPPEWQKRIVESLMRHFPPNKRPRPRRVWTATIGTSNTLVKDPEFILALLAGARSIAAVEMETGGVRRAARRKDRDYPVITIRGISDIVGLRRDPAWTTFACHSAASFAYALIKAAPIEPVSKRVGDKPTQQLFRVYPIQSRGENIFHIDKKGEPGGLDEFFVKVHFNLWTKYAIDIVNINLSYNLPTAMPGPQKISIDGPQDVDVYERLDSSYRMTKRRRIEERSVSNIFVSRRFICNYAVADHADYGIVTIDCEVTSSAWEGIKLLTIKGKLNPGGEFVVSEVTITW